VGLGRRHGSSLLAPGLTLPTAWARPPVLRAAAASDLKFVLAQLLDAFQKETGPKVEASHGSSANFARQIRQGLPVLRLRRLMPQGPRT